MKPMPAEPAACVKEARDILRRASTLLERARDRDREGGSDAVWWASCYGDDVDTIASDLGRLLSGEPPPVRTKLVAIGKAFEDDAGGSFGGRALQALALCREAWIGADQNNAPRVENAMAWLAHAWLKTCGDDRTATVRAVLTYGLDRGRRSEELVTRIHARIAQMRPATAPVVAGAK
jgi:hypothetical protein